jgi:hypothetical protein
MALQQSFQRRIKVPELIRCDRVESLVAPSATGRETNRIGDEEDGIASQVEFSG